ncbi:2Fe-2S iron-sulfur cluster-binding protein [Methylobacter sp. YRD-M1]|uniref:2Fe-2S iron-sulfur cluster-binding protein n=1 Tax=Methylobacter sp. YRD-M1 TaxID=2911520 RepID=UPI00227B3ADA|nr:2Fe-2S iron-sulfur cluster binding domain-containing protein [Methylobacter sp. YRD-M1]WAK01007.1 2Fe-2S iron-sulfur cluster binding domain-containing protein [Methylobacter sp. YRD-M1]
MVPRSSIRQTRRTSTSTAHRSGTCGLCRVKRLSGKVRMAVEDSLTESEKADGYILACQAEAESNVEIDA